MTIIDAHSHLWLYQNTIVEGQPIRSLASNQSRSEFFGEELGSVAKVYDEVRYNGAVPSEAQLAALDTLVDTK